jgi:hypothetical protein
MTMVIRMYSIHNKGMRCVHLTRLNVQYVGPTEIITKSERNEGCERRRKKGILKCVKLYMTDSCAYAEYDGRVDHKVAVPRNVNYYP